MQIFSTYTKTASKTSDIEKMMKKFKIPNRTFFFTGFFLHKPRRVWSETSWSSLINLGNKTCCKKGDVVVSLRILKENHHIVSFFGTNISFRSCSKPTKRYLTKPSEVYGLKTMQKKILETDFRFASSIFRYLRL